MDLVSILSKNIKPGDVMTFERKHTLCVNLSRLSPIQSKAARDLILLYKQKYDNVRRVGDSDSSIPYYGVAQPEGVEFSLNMLPENLQLLLEQLVAASI